MWAMGLLLPLICLRDPRLVLGGVNDTNLFRFRPCRCPEAPLPMPAMLEPKLIAGNANQPLARAIASAHDTVAEAKRLHSEEQERGGLAHVSRTTTLPI